MCARVFVCVCACVFVGISMCALLLNQIVWSDCLSIGYALCLASTKPTLRAETVETREHHPRLEAKEHYATLHTTQQPPLQVTSPSSPSNHQEEALALTIGLSVTCLYTSLDTNARHPSKHDHPVRKLPFELVLIGQPEVVSHCTQCLIAHRKHTRRNNCKKTRRIRCRCRNILLLTSC